MKYYTVLAFAQIAVGTLALTPAQARTRTHALKALGHDHYEVIAPVEFKIGETFGYDLELPRTLALALEEEKEQSPSLEDMTKAQLQAFAKELGLSLASNLSKASLLDSIKVRQDELLALQTARIADLEAKGEALTDKEKAELAALKGGA